MGLERSLSPMRSCSPSKLAEQPLLKEIIAQDPQRTEKESRIRSCLQSSPCSLPAHEGGYVAEGFLMEGIQLLGGFCPHAVSRLLEFCIALVVDVAVIAHELQISLDHVEALLV